MCAVANNYLALYDRHAGYNTPYHDWRVKMAREFTRARESGNRAATLAAIEEYNRVVIGQPQPQTAGLPLFEQEARG